MLINKNRQAVKPGGAGYISMSIKIPVIRKKRPLVIRISAFVHLMSWFLLIGVFVFIDSKILSGILPILIILSAICMALLKKNEVCGYTILNSGYIFIKNDFFEKQFFIRDIKDLRFKYNGCEGDSYKNPRVLIAKDGTGNFVEFSAQGIKYSVEVLLKRIDVLSLNKIFKEWEKVQIDFIPPRKLEKDIKRLIID
jgi:hypothetical protein